MAVNSAFDAVVEHYDQWIVKALPGYSDLFTAAVSILPFDEESSIDILDLGAGTGLFSYHVWLRFKRAKYVLYDSAAKMLEAAKKRFENSGNFTFKEGDLRDLSFDRQFDVVISSLSIHHLEDKEKQQLFSTVYRQLRAPGIFVNIDQIKAPTDNMSKIYWSQWLDHVHRKNADEEQLSASIQRRTRYDKDASLTDQLQWLADAGFTDVDCLYKYFFVGVFCAMKS